MLEEVDLKGYTPTEAEEFMNPKMKAYFRNKLMVWKNSLIEETEETVKNMQKINENKISDELDALSNEMHLNFDLRTKDRARKLINKIDSAIERIRNGTFGYCAETSSPISVRRLDARPITKYSLEAQERHERQERIKKGR